MRPCALVSGFQRLPMLACGILVVAACASEPLTTDTESISAEEYPARLAEAVCTAWGNCCGARDLPFDSAACVSEQTAKYTAELEQTLALAVEFDARAAARCIPSFTRSIEGCRVTGAELTTPPCDAVFIGLLSPGDACNTNTEIECNGAAERTAFCAPEPGTGTGVCTPQLAENDVCLGRGCGDGLYCDLFSTSCKPQQTSGTCLLISVCAEGFACSPDAECVAQLEDGAPCLLDLQCDGGLCDVTGRCAKTLESDLFCDPGAL